MTKPNAIRRFFSGFNRTNRYSHLFAMNDLQLASRGFDRDGLTRAYLAELSGR